MVLFQRSCFLIDGRHARLTPTKRADLMRFFEARPLLHEIGCALGKAHNVFHLKGVLRRPLETTPLIVMWPFMQKPVSEDPVSQELALMGACCSQTERSVRS